MKKDFSFYNHHFLSAPRFGYVLLSERLPVYKLSLLFNKISSSKSNFLQINQIKFNCFCFQVLLSCHSTFHQTLVNVCH